MPDPLSDLQRLGQEFDADGVLPDGKLVAHYAKTALVTAYETREVPPLLPDYSS